MNPNVVEALCVPMENYLDQLSNNMFFLLLNLEVVFVLVMSQEYSEVKILYDLYHAASECASVLFKIA